MFALRPVTMQTRFANTSLISMLILVLSSNSHCQPPISKQEPTNNPPADHKLNAETAYRIHRLMSDGKFEKAKSLLDSQIRDAQLGPLLKPYSRELKLILELSDEKQKELSAAVHFVDYRSDPYEVEIPQQSLQNLAIVENLLGKESLSYAFACQALSVHSLRQNQLGLAEHCAGSSLQTLKKTMAQQETTALSSFLLGQSLLLNRKFEAGIPYLNSARKSASTIVAFHSSLNLAEVLRRQGEHQGAVLMFANARSLAKRIPGKNEPYLHYAMNKLAETHMMLGNSQQGIDILEELTQLRGIQNDSVTAHSFESLARCYQQLGKLQIALNVRNKQYEIEQKINGPLTLQPLMTVYHISNLLRKLGRQEEAIQRLSPLFDECSKFGETDLRRLFIGGTLGAAFEELGEFELAERVLATVSSLPDQIRSESDEQQANNISRHAQVLSKLKRWEEAKSKTAELAALLLQERGTEDDEYINAQFLLADFERIDGNLEEARKLYQRLIKSLVLANRSRGLIWAQISLGTVSFRLGEVEAAREYLEQARQEYFTMDAQGLLPKRTYEELNPMIYLSALDVLANKPVSAWQHIEYATATRLMENLRKGRPLGLTPEENKLVDAKDVRGMTKLKEKYGDYAGAIYPLRQIQAHLDGDQAIVFWLGLNQLLTKDFPNGRHFGCVIRSFGEPIWIRLPAIEKADNKELHDRTRACLSDPTKPWKAATRALFSQMVQPLLPHLKKTADLPEANRLIVVPGATGIPIECLLVHDSDKDYEVTYAPSASVWAWLKQRRAQRRRVDPDKYRAFVVADPESGDRDLQGGRNTAASIEESFLNATVLVGKQASKTNVSRLAKSNEFNEFTHIHFATHASVNPYTAYASEIHLANPLDNGDLSATSNLTGNDLARWKTHADLVSLSACGSGLGRMSFREGFQGFCHPLFLAGANGVLVNHWEVSDVASSLMMSKMYEQLATGRGTMAAVKNAREWIRGLSAEQVERLIESGNLRRAATRGGLTAATINKSAKPFDHPYYWASHVFFGAP